ncbi:uroporphyrinogen-III C-methyltransferase [Nitrosophilus alvini]|uniref:uroporphyrinogen-III C-methyltransferase n=1 Tax=Nitrosophilus alvini TaxID=2714855 RepID=UPI00190CC0D5|nr:uroporphyrinogen-III C-methyltransferase [Nitrosophilus alvini]
MGKVYLTGAGPGDMDLLTIKALKVIRNADVVVYDRLVNPEILNEAPQDAEMIYVGKADGKHTLPQDEINEVLYQKALEKENVVRLKGGDPFVFGRGGEEAKYLRDRGIDFEIIPGVTSAISVPAYAGIPVTHRGIAVSFRVVTGHEAPNKQKSQIDWNSFRYDETIVFLMGLHNLANICENLIKIGKAPDTPCAVIQEGTTNNQKVAVGTLENIVETVKKEGIGTPALIIVGQVVSLREDLKWFR